MDAHADIDLAPLLAPAGADGAGEDLRADYTPQSLYYRLRDARAEARAAERAADAEGGLETAPPPQWRAIAALAVEALERSKDLEVAAWYTEALLRSDGLEGLAAGFRLMRGLVDAYWDTLYPRPDEDGMATRVAPVAGLNGTGGDGTLIQPLRKLVLFDRPDGGPLFYWQYEQSAEVSAIGDAARRQQRLAAGALPFEGVEAQARAAAPRLAVLRGAGREAAAAWQGMSEALDARAGADAPPTSRVRDLLGQIVEAAARYAGPEASVPAEAPPPSPEAGDSAPAPPRPTGRLETREDALRLLGEVSEFFRRTEPHSPLAYTLAETVRRARLPWPELLAEMVPDATARAAILNTLGIRPPSE
ncbi:MAG: type VI secretion system protein TssA [Acetobacteraceae bacterium]|nr:type VI secretion system protein TssA [Acetobacteraceae bacterium]